MWLARLLRAASSLFTCGSQADRALQRSGSVIQLREARRVHRGIPAVPSRNATLLAFLLMAVGAFAGFSLLLPALTAPGQGQPWVGLPPSTMRPQPLSPEQVWPLPSLSAPAWIFLDPSRSFRVAIGGVEEIGHVSDGDTLVAGERRIRLDGIDAPESDQTCVRQQMRVACGRLATRALEALVSGQRIRCTAIAVDRYGRDLSTCFRSDGADINRLMVASGWAIAYRRYSRAYEQAEAEARSRGLGLWAGSFVLPEEWRAGKR